MKKYKKDLLGILLAGSMLLCTPNDVKSAVVYAPQVHREIREEGIHFKDMTRDGIEDLVYVQYTEKGMSGGYSLMLAEGNKKGGFNNPKEIFSFGKQKPVSLKFKDITEDGIEDLVYVQHKDKGFLGGSGGYFLMVSEGNKRSEFTSPREIFFFGKKKPF